MAGSRISGRGAWIASGTLSASGTASRSGKPRAAGWATKSISQPLPGWQLTARPSSPTGPPSSGEWTSLSKLATSCKRVQFSWSRGTHGRKCARSCTAWLSTMPSVCARSSRGALSAVSPVRRPVPPPQMFTHRAEQRARQIRGLKSETRTGNVAGPCPGARSAKV